MVNTISRIVVIAIFVVNSLKAENRHEVHSKSGLSENEIFDYVIEKVVSDDDIGHKNFRAIPVSDLEKELEVTFMFMAVRASLTATQGVISDLTSLRRTSDVTKRTVGETTYFTAAVALGDLAVVFNNYHLRLGAIRKSGDRLALNVGKNSFLATFKSSFDGSDCQLTLEDLKVTELSGMKVDISGFSVFGFIGHYVVRWFVDYFYDLIWNITGTFGKDLVNFVIKDQKICEALFENNTIALVASLSTQNYIGTEPMLPETQTEVREPEIEDVTYLPTTWPRITKLEIPELTTHSTFPSSELVSHKEANLVNKSEDLSRTPVPGQNGNARTTPRDRPIDVLEMIAAIPGLNDP